MTPSNPVQSIQPSIGHTPTPWDLCRHLQSAEKDASCKCGYRGGIWGGKGEVLVCEMGNCNRHDGHDMVDTGDRATQLANAALIVEAVNSYAALKARITELEEALQFIADGYDNHDVNHVDYRVKAYQVALEALEPKAGT